MIKPTDMSESQITEVALAEICEGEISPRSLSRIVNLIRQLPMEQQGEIIDQLPPHACERDPLVASLVARHAVYKGRFQEALNSFECARAGFLRKDDLSMVFECDIAMVGIYQRLDDFATAQSCLLRAERLIHKEKTTKREKAGYFLALSRLSIDIGKARRGKALAYKALRMYEDLDEPVGQFLTYMELARHAKLTADFLSASTYTENAKRFHSAYSLGDDHLMDLLNSEGHLYWFQGQIDAAVEVETRLSEIADSLALRGHPTHYQFYARLVLANLYRVKGAFADAERYYALAQEFVYKHGLTHVQCWININRAWMFLLQDNLPKAQSLIMDALRTTDLGQRRSFSVCHAILLTKYDQFKRAINLLDESLNYYGKSGDILAIYSIKLHQAWIHMEMESMNLAISCLQSAFALANRYNITFTPHWWDPQTVASVCMLSIEQGVCVERAEQVVAHQLGQDQIVWLSSRLIGKVSGLVTNLVAKIDNSVLADVEDERIKAMLSEFLASGILQPGSLQEIAHFLRTAETYDKPNYRLIVILALYLQHVPNREIAIRIDRSEKLVRNYIGQIYEIFGIPSNGFLTRKQRKEALSQAAKQRGFL